MFLTRCYLMVAACRLTLASNDEHHPVVPQHPLEQANTGGTISSATREYWMSQAIEALHTLVSPCPPEAFGTVMVNHTDSSERGKLVCIGANESRRSGNPASHGEIAAINNCTAILTDPQGQYKLSAAGAVAAYRDLTLYTTAEPCPMCASAIRWAGFKGCVFATSIPTLFEMGWNQINLTSEALFEYSSTFKTRTALLGGVLREETDPLFAWQANASQPCPRGCGRDNASPGCSPYVEAAETNDER